MIKAYILKFFKQFGFTYKVWTTGYILDKQFKIIKGSIRTRPDNDDAWLFALSKNSSHIFDIGSNIGQAALMMLYHDSVEKVYLVDPNPKALSMAAENVIQNNLSMRTEFICAFMSEKSNVSVDFYTQDSGAAGSFYKGFAKTAAKSDSHYQVNTLTLDYLSDYYKITPDLIKIDVEGAEREVLKGAKGVASKLKTVFFVEIHSGPELTITENTQGILNWCDDNKYTAWYLKNKTKLQLESIKTRGRFHVLLLPEGQSLPKSILSIKEKDVISEQ